MPKTPEFSLAAMVAAVAADTWHSKNSLEREVVRDLERRYGPRESGNLLPADSLRDLNVASAPNLTSTANVGYIEALQPASRVVQLGATPAKMGPGSTVYPRGVTAVSTSWLSTESTQTTEANPTFEQIAFTRHELSAYVEVSRTMLLQVDAENVLRREIRNALGAAADAAWIGGTGLSGQPTGIASQAGLSITGTTLSYSALMDGAQSVADANAVIDVNSLGYLTTPAVARLLKGRFVNTNYAPIWQGQLAAGSIEDAPAFASKNVPTATLLYGDWSQVLIAEWADGLTMAVDPFTKFNTGLVGIRAIMSTDVALAHTDALAAATGVT